MPAAVSTAQRARNGRRAAPAAYAAAIVYSLQSVISFVETYGDATVGSLRETTGLPLVDATVPGTVPAR